MARKTKSVYAVTKTLLRKVKRLAKGGLSQRQIAISLGWSDETWHKKKREHPELADAIKEGQTANIKELVSAAHKSAKGYSYVETHTEFVRVKEKDKEKESTEIITKVKEITKKVAPVPTSLIFLLTNLDPDNFKHRSEQMIKGELEMKVGSIQKKDVKKVNDLFDEITEG